MEKDRPVKLPTLSSMRHIVLAVATFFLFTPTQSVYAEAGEWIYTVKAGDTLIGVSHEFLIKPNNWRLLQKLNHVTTPTRMQTGTILRIPIAWLKRMDAVADVVRVQGEVIKIARNSGETSALVVGAQLVVGDEIKTAIGSNLTLRFVDGSRILLAENSRATLSNMTLFGRTGMAQTMLLLQQGRVDTQVSPQAGPAAKYEIRTPAINLAVRGTDFRVSTNSADDLSRSEVISGRVLGAAEKGEVSLEGGFGTLVLVGQAPSPPIRLLGAPDLSTLPALVEKVQLHFQWPCSSGVHQYRAQIFADRTFEQLLRDDIFNHCAATWTDLPDAKYVLRVREVDSHGLEGLNAEHDFILKARPEAPFVAEPQDGQTVRGNDASFTWAQPVDIQHYHFQLSKTPNITDVLVDLPKLGENGYKVELAPGTYYWRVASLTTEGNQGPYSDIQSFTQKQMPEAPLVESTVMDKNQIAFRWKAGDAGEKFQIQLADDPAFQHVLVDKITADAQVSMPSLKGGIYYMRVKTIEMDGFSGAYGPAQRIEIPRASAWWLLLPLLAPLF